MGASANFYPVSFRTSNELCAICQAPFERGQAGLSHQATKEVFHQFHRDCINPWLAFASNCPTCRIKADDFSVLIAREERERGLLQDEVENIPASFLRIQRLLTERQQTVPTCDKMLNVASVAVGGIFTLIAGTGLANGIKVPSDRFFDFFMAGICAFASYECFSSVSYRLEISELKRKDLDRELFLMLR